MQCNFCIVFIIERQTLFRSLQNVRDSRHVTVLHVNINCKPYKTTRWYEMRNVFRCGQTSRSKHHTFCWREHVERFQTICSLIVCSSADTYMWKSQWCTWSQLYRRRTVCKDAVFYWHAHVARTWVGAKPGIWTLNWTMDWTTDWFLDWVLDWYWAL